MEEPRDIRRNDIYDHFHTYVQAHLRDGQDAQGRPARFIPTRFLRTYWDPDRSDRISDILNSTRDRQPPIDFIFKHLLRAFSLLVWISKTNRPYVHYLYIFNQFGRQDIRLPFMRCPDFLSIGADRQELFDAFFEHQWMFFPVALEPNSMYERDLDPKQILPWRVIKDVGQYKVGRPAKIQLARLEHPDDLSLSAQSEGCIILKSYSSNSQTTFDNEVQAFTTLENEHRCDNILRYLGSYFSEADVGPSYTIMLEYADRGTLHDIYKRNNPPVTFEEIRAFWLELKEVVKSLMVIQNQIPKRLGNSCIHQDIKPQNIFAFSHKGAAAKDFRSLLKIGDFGESSVKRADPLEHPNPAYDSGASRMFCPPELHCVQDLKVPIDDRVDVWAIGCVLLEAAVWITSGEFGRVDFQKRRQEEIEARASGDDGSVGCCSAGFHDGKEPLRVVTDVLEYVIKNGRRCDGLTSEIARLVLRNVLVGEGARYSARILHAELNDLIVKSQEVPYWYDSSTNHGSVASSADLSWRRGDHRSSHGHNPSTDSYRSATSPYYSPTSPPTNSKQTFHPSSQLPQPPTQGNTSPIPFLLMPRPPGNGGNDHQPIPNRRNEHPRAPPWNSEYLNQDRLHHPDPLDMSPFLAQPIHFASDEEGEQRVPRSSQLSFTDPVSSPRDSSSPSLEIPSSTIDRTDRGEVNHHFSTYSWRNPSPSEGVISSPKPRVKTNGTTSTGSTAKPRPSRANDERKASGASRTPFNTDLTIEHVLELRTKCINEKWRRTVPGESQAMPHLKKREHMFLVDNSASMKSFKNEVIELLTALTWILEEADDDGMDVICTSNWERRKNRCSADAVVNFVKENFDKESSSVCFIEKNLDTVVSGIIKDLPVGREKKKFLNSWVPGRKYKGRPVNVYILTDGVWGSGADTNNSCCGADRPIERIIKALSRANLPRTQVAFQFIRFGNSEEGKKRLVYLDDGIKKFHGLDIVDHKESTDKVWPILIGSLVEYVDEMGQTELG